MTDAELDEALAVEVMGSRKGRINPHPSNPVFWLDDSKPNRESLSYYSWHPTADLNQAFEVLDKFAGYEIVKSTHEPTNKYRIRIWFDSGDTVMARREYGDNLARTICETALEARGAK